MYIVELLNEVGEVEMFYTADENNLKMVMNFMKNSES